MKKYLLVMLVGAAVSLAACSNPSSPSASKDAQKPATAAATGDGAAAPQAGGGNTSTPVPNTAMVIIGPRADAPGCLSAAALPDVVEWRITNVPAGAKVDRGYGHEDAAGCGATERSLRTENDHLRYLRDPADPTTLIIRFDKNTFTCGHTQVDISLDGINVIGEVVNYGEDCKPPETPPCVGAACNPTPDCTVTGTCAPVDCKVTGTCPPPPLTECLPYIGTASVRAGLATFQILPGGNVQLSLVAFQANPDAFLPQKFVARSVGTFGPGTHTLTVGQPPLYQVDLMCGAYPEGEDLTEANFGFWHFQTIAFDSSLYGSNNFKAGAVRSK